MLFTEVCFGAMVVSCFNTFHLKSIGSIVSHIDSSHGQIDSQQKLIRTLLAIKSNSNMNSDSGYLYLSTY